MINERKLEGFDSKLKYSKLNYPKCKCKGNCPDFYWNYLATGVRQSGKTYNCIRLLKHYEDNKELITDKDGNQYDLRYFLISPTSSANPIYQSLNSLDFENDVYDCYNDSVLQKIMDEVDMMKQKVEEYMKYKQAYKIYLKLGEEKLNKMKDQDLVLLANHDFEHPDMVFEDLKYKKPTISVIILDDLLGSECFSKKNQSLLKYYLIRNRHKKICFAILSQAMRSIPKDIRLNCNVFFFGAFKNEKVIREDLYDEVSKELSPDEFLEVFNHCTKEQYGSLVIDCSKDKIKLSKGWDVGIEYHKKNLIK